VLASASEPRSAKGCPAATSDITLRLAAPGYLALVRIETGRHSSHVPFEIVVTLSRKERAEHAANKCKRRGIEAGSQLFRASLRAGGTYSEPSELF
jgi:hypothetical protein